MSAAPSSHLDRVGVSATDTNVAAGKAGAASAGHGDCRAHAHGGHGGEHAGAPTRALLLTLALTLGYAAVEAAMAFWSGSLSLLADAGHMVTDAGALGLSLAAARIALRPRSATKTYGYRRAEVLGAFINASVMLVIALSILVEAGRRMHTPQSIHGHGMLYTALVGLVVNVVAVLILARSGGTSLNVRSALLHVAGDALGSVAAIVAGGCVVLFGFALADPLASAVISVVLVVGSLRLLREAAGVLMEGAPAGLDPLVITRTLLETPGVHAVHDLHLWCLTPSEPMLTAHVVLTPAAHGTDVAKRVGDRLRALHGIEHVTIQPEAPQGTLVTLRVPDPSGKAPKKA